MGVESWQLDDAVARACSRAVQPGDAGEGGEERRGLGYEHGTEGVKSGGPVGFRVHKGSIGYVAREAFPQVSDNQGMTKNEISENGDFPGEVQMC